MGTGLQYFGAGTPALLHGREAVIPTSQVERMVAEGSIRVDGVGVPRIWPGSTVVLIACGPSLSPADVELVRQAHAAGLVRVIAVNAAIRLAPWADVRFAHHAIDWARPEDAELLAGFKGLRFGVDGDAAKHGVTLLRIENGGGLETTRRDTIKHGKNSGYQSINVAVHLGARRIVLLGYDMKRSAANSLHFYPCNGKAGANDFAEWLRYFATLPEPLRAAGVEVVNATRESDLNVFPRVSIEEALA